MLTQIKRQIALWLNSDTDQTEHIRFLEAERIEFVKAVSAANKKTQELKETLDTVSEHAVTRGKQLKERTAQLDESRALLLGVEKMYRHAIDADRANRALLDEAVKLLHEGLNCDCTTAWLNRVESLLSRYRSTKDAAHTSPGEHSDANS